jgi:hypothetical protein
LSICVEHFFAYEKILTRFISYTKQILYREEIAMKSKRAIGLIFVVIAILSLAALSCANATPRFLKQLKLMSSTDAVVWSHIPGNQVSDFKLKLDPSVPYYYLDVMSLKPMKPIINGYYGFFVVGPFSDEYEAFWFSKGADPLGSPLQVRLYEISHGTSPIFYLRVDASGYMLLDGFLKDFLGVEAHLRVDGDYPLGTYTYTGDIMGNDITMQIMFK